MVTSPLSQNVLPTKIYILFYSKCRISFPHSLSLSLTLTLTFTLTNSYLFYLYDHCFVGCKDNVKSCSSLGHAAAGCLID